MESTTPSPFLLFQHKGPQKIQKEIAKERERKGYFGLIIEELGGIYIFSWVDEEQVGVHTFLVGSATPQSAMKVYISGE